MANDRKKSIRAAFRLAVFERDGYHCVMCGRPGQDRQSIEEASRTAVTQSNRVILDAHHICDRHLMPYGGYVAENGITVCEDCHVKAESHWATPEDAAPGYSPEELFKRIDSSIENAWSAATEQLAPHDDA